MSSTLLVSAVFSSLAAGVLIAYGICLGMFRVFRVHSLQAAQQRVASSESQTLSAVQMAGN